MKKVIVFLVLILLSSYSAYSQYKSLFQKLKGQKYPTAYYDGREHFLGNFPLNQKKVHNPVTFEIKQYNNELNLSVEYEGLGKAVNLMDKIDDKDKLFEGYIGEDGSLCEMCCIEAGLYDFDNDDFGEIIVCISDGIIDMYVFVFKYTPSKDNALQGTKREWKVVGAFTGQSKIYIDKKSIILPYGSQGLFTGYEWKNGKFVEINTILD